MKITIISGGSGNSSILSGIKQLYDDADIKIITNMYDSGKSTGICRKVTDTLGVSDVRKNHYRMYSLCHKDNIDPNLKEFYNNRYDLDASNVYDDVTALLKSWNLGSKFSKYAKSFFSRPQSKLYEYKDFSIANIIYSEMYARLGYEDTNRIFCDLLNIDDCVIINSFDNVYITAITETNSRIDDEGDIVEYKNPLDKIIGIDYSFNDNVNLNPKAIQRVLDSDLIIISTGTFWSSIYPTLDYGQFYMHINESNAKKIWCMNNEEDKDAFGVTSNDFIHILTDLGLDLSTFTIIENLDAASSMQVPNHDNNVVYYHLDNDGGKHSAIKCASCILRQYYNISDIDSYDKIIFDFDDTLVARDLDNHKLFMVSHQNMDLIHQNITLHDKYMIISGNTFSAIETKLRALDMSDMLSNLSIWADSNSTLYIDGVAFEYIDKLQISDIDIDYIIETLKHLNIKFIVADNGYITANIKIRPLSEDRRHELEHVFNDQILINTNCVAKIAGTSTLDIVHRDNDKSAVFWYSKLDKKKTLFIGDEIDSGNDSNIAKLCNNYIAVSDVLETNCILKLITMEF